MLRIQVINPDMHKVLAAAFSTQRNGGAYFLNYFSELRLRISELRNLVVTSMGNAWERR